MADTTSVSEKEVTKYFAFNETGNIMVSSTVETEKDLREEVVDAFQKVAVLFDAISTAIMKSDKDINDYHALNNLLGKSVWCAQVHTECRTVNLKDNTVAINVKLITDILGDVSLTGGAMKIAKKVLSSIGLKLGNQDNQGGLFTVERNSYNIGERVAHILFVCEDLMGMPLISIQCIHAKKDHVTNKIKVGECGNVATNDVELSYQVDTYMFVDPAYIEKFTPEFKKDRAFDALIEDFKNKINGDPVGTNGQGDGVGPAVGTPVGS